MLYMTRLLNQLSKVIRCYLNSENREQYSKCITALPSDLPHISTKYGRSWVSVWSCQAAHGLPNGNPSSPSILSCLGHRLHFHTNSRPQDSLVVCNELPTIHTNTLRYTVHIVFSHVYRRGAARSYSQKKHTNVKCERYAKWIHTYTVALTCWHCSCAPLWRSTALWRQD